MVILIKLKKVELFIKMNNRGQALVVFIIMIPIFFMLLGVVIDISYASYEKRKIENNIKYVARTSFDKRLDEEKIEDLILTNLDDVKEYKVYYDNNSLNIYVKAKVNGVFSNLFNNPIKNIEVNYKAYFDGDNVIVERG